MKLIKTSFFSAVITFIRLSSGFVAGKVLAIFTGPSGVAFIGQFTNFITIVLTFANGAINTGVVKYTAEYENDEQKLKTLFSTSLKFSIYCSLIIGAILLVAATPISHWIFASSAYSNPIRVLGVTIALYSLNSLLISILNGKKEIKTYTIVNTAGSLIGLLFTTVLVFFFKIQGALYAMVLSQSIVFMVTVVFVIRLPWFSWQYFSEKFDRAAAKQLSKFSLMAIVSVLTVPVSQILLRNIVIEKLGVDAAGFWQGMMRISDGYLMLLTTALSTYYLPKLSHLQKKSDIKKEVVEGYKIIIPSVFCSCMVIYFLRYFIIKTLYTSTFNPMADLFLFQLIGDFFKMAAWILGYLMLAKAMTKIFIVTEIVFSLSYILLGLLCIKLFHLQGITIAFALNYLIYFFFMIFIFRKLLFGDHE